MGGQTGLNAALDLNKHGVLKEFNVELIGATKEAIDKAEDRELFAAVSYTQLTLPTIYSV